MVANEFNSAQTVIDNLHSAVIVIGEKLQIICLNPAAEMLFHISSNRAAGKHIGELIIDAHEFIDRIERSLISAHPYTVYDEALHLHTHQSIGVDYSVSPVQYAEDQKTLLLEFYRLKSQQKLTQEESIFSQYEATKSLLRGLAHEIKNPLGGIRGAAQLLERELDDENKQFTQIIISETDRLKNLLDRMVGPKEIPTKSELNIHKILEHVRQLVLAENDDVLLSIDYDPSIPELHADESMLIQVILNLTRNAVRAASEVSENQGHIIFRTRAKRNCTIGTKTFPLVAKVDIEDNGIGVAEELQEKIFMPMITGHAEGTGLGLSIAQSLVQQHKGLIEFKSEPGKTVFTILLPITTSNGENE
jgi:two-component system nitrogen regulation sensor histidine kinase GlnL